MHLLSSIDIKNIIIMTISIIFCLIFIEIFVRSYIIPLEPGYGYPQNIFVKDPDLIYGYKPGFFGKFKGDLYRNIEIQINSLGFRDDEKPIEKNDKFRIIALGDSVVFGSGLPYEYTIFYKLEKKLMSNGKNVEIFKWGVNSYSFEQYLTLLKKKGVGIKPDLIIVGFTINDIDPIDKEKVEKMIFGETNKTNDDLKEIIKNICRTCIYLNRLFLIKNETKDKTYEEAYLDMELKRWASNDWNETKKRIIEMVSISKQNDFNIVFILFPYKEQLRNNEKQQNRILLHSFCKDHNITLIDPFPIFEKYQPIEDLYLKKDSIHFNEKGNEIIVESIYPIIEKIIDSQK